MAAKIFYQLKIYASLLIPFHLALSCASTQRKSIDLAGFWMKNPEIGIAIKYETNTKDRVRTLLLTGMDGQPRGADHFICKNSICTIGDADFTYFQFKVLAVDTIEALMPIISDVDGDGGKYHIIKKGDILSKNIHHVYDKSLADF